MEFDRVVQLIAARDDGTRTLGTGYLIGPRLVLTAAHVVASGTSATISVRQPRLGDRAFAGAVCWIRLDAAVDAALVEITDTGWVTPDSLSISFQRPPQRWGWLATHDPRCPVEARGFPRMQVRDGVRVDEHFTGWASAGTGDLAHRYELLSSAPLPLPRQDETGSGWAGFSGASVFAGELLIGVVRHDRRADSADFGSRLSATRVWDLLHDASFREAVRARTGWDAEGEPAELTEVLAPIAIERDLRSPTMLLRADVEAVPFVGREHEYSELMTWCESRDPGLSIRVLAGSGGQGKTRLARQLAASLREQGWIAGQLRADLHDTAATAGPDLSLFARLATKGLIIVDYAETRPQLVRELINRTLPTRQTVRLLLIARSSGGWQTDAMNATRATHDALAAAPVIELAQLYSASHRTQAFTEAVHSYAELLGLVHGYEDTDWAAVANRITGEGGSYDLGSGTALALQMNALTSLLQFGSRPATEDLHDGAEATLLRHEERYWDRSAQAHGLASIPTSVRKNAVAAAVLCGAETEEQAVATIKLVPHFPADRALHAAQWLRQLYPPEQTRYWGSIQPDLVAEYHASQVITQTGNLLPALLSGTDPVQQIQALTVACRAVIAHANAHRVEMAIALRAILERILEDEPWLPSFRVGLHLVQRALPPSNALLHISTLMNARLVEFWHDEFQEDPTSANSYGHALERYATDLARAGDSQAAAPLFQAAVMRLSSTDLSERENLEILARTLSNYSTALAETNKLDMALVTSLIAADIHRQLGDREEIASATNRIALRQYESGETGLAREALEDSVRLYRRLAEEDPRKYEARLAAALANLGRIYLDLHEAATLDIFEEAVAILGRSAQREPDANGPEFYSILSSYAEALYQQGRTSEALATIRTAVENQFRMAELAQSNETWNTVNGSLMQLWGWLENDGATDEIPYVRERLVLVLRQWIKLNPSRGLELVLARLLTEVALDAMDADRIAEALTLSTEGVTLSRKACNFTSAHDIDNYVSTLVNFAVLRLSACVEPDQTLAMLNEASEWYKKVPRPPTAKSEDQIAGLYEVYREVFPGES
jgi:tetratricopeptide (TPR) repeat protein